MRRFARLSLALVVLFPLAAWTQTLTVDGSNSPFVVATAATYDQVTVASGGVLLANALLTVRTELAIRSGGRVTLAPGVYFLRLDVGTLTVDLGGSIDAAALGLPTGRTIDPVTSGIIPCTGLGGRHYSPGYQSRTDLSYDDPGDPQLPGSGGINAPSVGGGAILVRATSAAINGTLRADGQQSATNDSRGAGGTINLAVANFSGGGVLRAVGGSGAYWGASGLIRIAYTGQSTFSGSYVVDNPEPAGVGTALLVKLPERDAMIVGGAYPLRAGESFNSMTPLGGTAVDVTGRATISQPLDVAAGATLVLQHPQALAAITLGRLDGVVQVTTSVEAQTDVLVRGQLLVDAPFRVPNLDTVAGAVITHSAGVSTMALTATGTVRIVSGARIDGIGKGLAPNRTIDPVTGSEIPGSAGAAGGSHAGAGAGPGVVASTYDDPANPRYPGGGGGTHCCGGRGGLGGGVLRVTAALLQIDGIITADGTAPTVNDTGSGAGGTVALVAAQLAGSGAITARGYVGTVVPISGGGGGIVNLSWTTSTFTGTTSAAGGVGVTAGSPGAVVVNARPSAPKVTSSPPGVAVAGRAWSYAPRAVGVAPMTWALVNAPTGATIDAATGVVRWTPAAEGGFPFGLTATNTQGADTQRFTVSVSALPTITSTALGAAVLGEPYHYDLDDTATANGTGPLAWEATLAPPGLTIDATLGLVWWTPSSLGDFPVCLQVANVAGSAQQCFAVAVGTRPDGGASPMPDGGMSSTPPKFSMLAGTTAHCGAPYRYSAERRPAVSGDGPFTFTVQGALGLGLPAGLSVDTATGEFAWTPDTTQVGAHPLQLTVTGPGGSDTQAFAVVVECEARAPAGLGCGCSSGLDAGTVFALAALGALRPGRRRVRRGGP